MNRLFIRNGTIRHYIIHNVECEPVEYNYIQASIKLLSGETVLVPDDYKFMQKVAGHYYKSSLSCPVAYLLQMVGGKLEILNELHILPALIDTDGNSIVKLIEGKPVFIQKKEYN